VDEVFVVDEFDAPDHLVRQHEDSFHCESPGAEIEKILQTGTQ
jgi:hypothetical protein